jgi:N-acetylglucosamine-6-phosphate deacetylase
MTGSVLVRGGNVLHGGAVEPGTDVLVDGASITEIGNGLRSPAGAEVIDARGHWVLPGLIDIHCHGMRDVMVDKDNIHLFAAYQLQNGVTACLPTLAGSPKQNMERMREVLRETKDFSLTPNLAGFRPEIMYLALASGGSSASLVKPEPRITEAVWNASGGRIRIWDISPEIEGALEFIQRCSRHDITSSMAHSSASIAQVRAAVDAGMSLVTHFYNLFPMGREVDEGVYPAGVTDYINVEDRLSVEIIPDGVHVHPLLIETTLRCKGTECVAFITDSLMGAGLPPGTYEGLIPGEPVEVTADRGIRRKSDGILSGSALTALAGFRNAVSRFGQTVPRASRLCSENPARLAGLSAKGRIAAGMDADLIILDSDFELKLTMVAGRTAWRAV